MDKEQHDRLSESIEYFNNLDVWVKRWHKSCYEVKRRNLSQYVKVVGESMFSQVEINRILTNK